MSEKTITVLFGDGITARTEQDAIFQWDTGRRLRFGDIALPAAYSVHFGSQLHAGDAMTQIGNAEGVAIPDQLLESGEYVYAWLWLDGRTERVIVMPVTKRAKPGGEAPEPRQQGVIDQILAALNEGVSAAENAADAASDSASDAAQAVQGVADAIEAALDRRLWSRVSALEGCAIVETGPLIETVGKPPYVGDPTAYAPYGITDTGWYVFARIAAPTGVTVSAETTVSGAAGAIITAGAAYIDVAVWFGVTAESQLVTIDWGSYEDQLVFKATDLAVRNLDYRTTFYLYDLAPFVTWTYALTTDTTFAAGKNYYTKDGDVYTLAEVTVGEAIPADTYYTHSKAHFEGMTRNVTYKLDTMIDCPIEIALPEIDDAGYGAWFEIQLRYNGSYSCTLLPPTGVKIGTVSTQSQTAGINVIDLQYTGVGGVAMWSLLNTHSNIPT